MSIGGNVVRLFTRSIAVLLLVGIQFFIPTKGISTASAEILGGSWTLEASESQAKVTWDIPIDVKLVQLFEDGQLVAEGDAEGYYEDGSVTPTDEIEYTLVVKLPLSDNQVETISQDRDLAPAEVQRDFESVAISGLAIKVPVIGFASESAAIAATALPNSTTVRYTTFIPNSTVAAPAGVCTPLDGRDYRFLGDNRRFSPTASSFRTRFSVTVDWLNYKTTASKSVGQTQRQVLITETGLWVPHAYATASNSTMIYKTITPQTNAWAHFQMKQDVVNPFCNDFFTNGIYFDFDVSIYRSGSYYISGVALTAPAHEMYIKDSDTTVWSMVFQRPTATMACLTAGLPLCNVTDTYYGNR